MTICPVWVNSAFPLERRVKVACITFKLSDCPFLEDVIIGRYVVPLEDVDGVGVAMGIDDCTGLD